MLSNKYLDEIDKKVEDEPCNYKGPYCCIALDYQIEDVFCPVGYSQKWREYSIQDLQSSSISLMEFCPYCGARFPVPLRDKWFDILEKEYGLESPISGDKKKVPADFLTDEWWKKRGL